MFPWKVFTDITNYLPHMKKLKLMNHMKAGGLQSFKVNVLTYLVVECIFLNDKNRQSADNASNLVCAG